jgi:glycosyltransferase involved in cell wall biosynthesis
MRRFRLVWHLRDILPPSALRGILGMLARVAPDRILAISDAVARSLPGDPRVRVVWNGIEPRTPVSPGRFRQDHRLGEGPLVGMVGQIARWKDQHVFVDAVASIAARHPAARFLIVGSVVFPENETGYRLELEERIRAAGLEDRIALMGPVADVLEVMRDLDLLVQPRRLPPTNKSKSSSAPEWVAQKNASAGWRMETTCSRANPSQDGPYFG